MYTLLESKVGYKMSIIRRESRKNSPYVVLSKEILEIETLSWKSKGVWAYLMSRPDNWEVSVAHLSKHFNTGKDLVRSMINELEDHGLCTKTQFRDEKGRISGIDYTIHEVQQPAKELKEKVPDKENPGLVAPSLAKPTQISNESKYVMKETTTGKEKTAVALFEKPKPKIHDCLADIDIPPKDKQEITERYPEQNVKHAIEWAKHPDTKITKGLIAALKWACKNQPQIPKSAEKVEENNRTYASQYDNFRNKIAQICSLAKSVEISFPCSQKESVCIKYDCKEFKTIFNDLLQRLGIPLRQSIGVSLPRLI